MIGSLRKGSKMNIKKIIDCSFFLNLVFSQEWDEKMLICGAKKERKAICTENKQFLENYWIKSDYSGKNIQVSTISSLDNIKNNSVLFYSKMSDPDFNLKDTVHYDLKKLTISLN